LHGLAWLALRPVGLTVRQDALPILNILVPQTGHLPSVAGLPFFMVMGAAFCISRFSRHFRQ